VRRPLCAPRISVNKLTRTIFTTSCGLLGKCPETRGQNRIVTGAFSCDPRAQTATGAERCPCGW
jgi:hypothetical protein